MSVVGQIEISPGWVCQIHRAPDRDAFYVIAPSGVGTVVTGQMLLDGKDSVTIMLRNYLISQGVMPRMKGYVPPQSPDCLVRVIAKEE